MIDGYAREGLRPSDGYAREGLRPSDGNAREGLRPFYGFALNFCFAKIDMVMYNIISKLT